MNRYCLNKEIVDRLNRRRRPQLALLIVLITFMAFNFVLYQKERSLQTLYDALVDRSQRDEMEEEYFNFLEESDHVGKKDLREYLAFVEHLTAQRIVVERDHLLLTYSDRSLREIRQELESLGQKIKIQIVEIRETREEKSIQVEVRL
ncbi:MAG: hypothetical protein Q4A75_03920 [Peptostreptococcaceae bacterium]|nr:hypothetical protein [Peptostreptococcaceae bacterium]